MQKFYQNIQFIKIQSSTTKFDGFINQEYLLQPLMNFFVRKVKLQSSYLKGANFINKVKKLFDACNPQISIKQMFELNKILKRRAVQNIRAVFRLQLVHQIKMDTPKESSFYESTRFLKDLTLVNQTTKSQALTLTPSAIQCDTDPCSTYPADLSFQLCMHRQNVEAIERAACKYLAKCLEGDHLESLSFKDVSLCVQKQRFACQKQTNILSSLISQNQLFEQSMKQELQLILQSENSLTIFLKQIHQTFGIIVGKELTYIIFQILREKYRKYKQIIKPRPFLLPMFHCCQYFEEDFKQLESKSPIFDQINIKEVVIFAQNCMQAITKRLLNTKKLEIINLKQVALKINPKVNIFVEFATLLKQVSKSLFLTLAGGTHENSSNDSLFDLLQDYSFTDQVDQSAQNSFIRLFSEQNDDQNYAFIAKKVKLQ